MFCASHIAQRTAGAKLVFSRVSAFGRTLSTGSPVLLYWQWALNHAAWPTTGPCRFGIEPRTITFSGVCYA